jgi:hypothetical protein
MPTLPEVSQIVFHEGERGDGAFGPENPALSGAHTDDPPDLDGRADEDGDRAPGQDKEVCSDSEQRGEENHQVTSNRFRLDTPRRDRDVFSHREDQPDAAQQVVADKFLLTMPPGDMPKSAETTSDRGREWSRSSHSSNRTKSKKKRSRSHSISKRSRSPRRRRRFFLLVFTIIFFVYLIGDFLLAVSREFVILLKTGPAVLGAAGGYARFSTKVNLKE